MLYRNIALLLSVIATGVDASYDAIAGYEPGSDVVDHSRIDLDQAAMELVIKDASEDAFLKAKAIYENGGHSKSHAVLTLSTGLTMAVDKSAAISDGTIMAKSYGGYDVGATEIKAVYKTLGACAVGGLDVTTLDGCFPATGTITIGDADYAYTYDPLVDNNAARTIQGFSSKAEGKMETDGTHPEYFKAKTYYGTGDFGDKWVTAALDGTKYTYENGEADFALYGLTGRGEAVKKGTVYLNVHTYVLHEFEDAILDCKKACAECNEDAVHAWDEGVAFHTGSTATDADNGGKLLYALANKRCQNFKTCGAAGNEFSGNSMVNVELLKLFNEGRDILTKGEKCDDAANIVRKIEDLLTVPFVQGTLRYAYKVGVLGSTEKESAEGAVFAAALLPGVHNCDPAAAKIVAENMAVVGPGNYNVNQAAVKTALESTYKCLGITCAHVGGLVKDKDTGAYYEGAEACGVDKEDDKDDKDDSSSGYSVGVGAAALVGAAAVIVM